MGFFDAIKKLNIFTTYTKLTEDFYDELEERLILADMGVESSVKAVQRLRERCEEEKIGDTERGQERSCGRFWPICPTWATSG